jgi:hypothetical protein
MCVRIVRHIQDDFFSLEFQTFIIKTTVNTQVGIKHCGCCFSSREIVCSRIGCWKVFAARCLLSNGYDDPNYLEV